MKNINNEDTKLYKEIAEQLDCGNTVFLHKATKKLICIPDSLDTFNGEYYFFEADFEEVEKKFDNYLK